MREVVTLDTFRHFGPPESNFFRLPNDWIDLLHDLTSLAELKVVEYVARHTWGFQEYGILKRITIDEFMNGRKCAPGSKSDIGGGRMDRGTGLSNKSVVEGIKLAVKHGLLEEEKDESDKGRIKKWYCLRMDDGANYTPDVKNLHSTPKLGVNDLHSASEVSSYRTEKETLERNHSLSIERKKGSGRRPKGTDPDVYFEGRFARLIQA